jgi:hypothetical protein
MNGLSKPDRLSAGLGIFLKSAQIRHKLDNQECVVLYFLEGVGEVDL